MNKLIDLSKSVFELCNQYPEVIDIMRSLGFDNIIGVGMLNTVGRVMTIPKGAHIKEIPLEHIISTFEGKGFTIKQ